MLTAARIEVLGISRWKRWQIDQFLRPRCTTLRYATTPEQALRRQAQHRSQIVVWASREPEGFAERAALQGAQLWRMEDGFLRSVGLGSNHIGGASLVLDDKGIYYDPRTPSRLERLLQAGSFAPELLQRAGCLRRQLVESGLTKYNVGSIAPPSLGGDGLQRLLVIGQVEDDASIRLGAAAVRTNLGLLQAVRQAHPGAWLVYKPHPDVEAGTRSGRIEDAVALAIANQVVRNVATPALFGQCDAVHVISSLAGFEALLRHIPVVVWGRPFYAGWGLTEDQAALPSRTRRVELDELVAASLIEYPLYIDPANGNACEVEDVVRRLASRSPATARREASWLLRNARLVRGSLRSLR
jgi:capsular polysaccharide export protein